MTLVAFLYYQNEKTLYFDLTKANMQNVTSKLSSRIISSHMANTTLDTSKLLETKEYKISFYNENKEKIFGNLDDDIDFSKEFATYNPIFADKIVTTNGKIELIKDGNIIKTYDSGIFLGVGAGDITYQLRF
mgnify:CR=1 FL=1